MKAPDFWQRGGAPAALLKPLSLGYAAAAALRRTLSTARRAPVPVLCVGNLTAGGAGKTPVAISLGERLIARGRTVHFLSRGYGGKEPGPVQVDPDVHRADDVGDEPLLLARTAPCWVARNRIAGAIAAAAAGAEVVVMDDGFQNPTIHKDLSLVVIDGETGVGNGRLIPAGPLREPVRRGLRRADAVVVLGPNKAGMTAMVPREMPLLHAMLAPDASDDLAGAAVFAFAGIGRPEKFFETLESIGCRLLGRESFPDHHPYTEAEIDRLIDRARQTEAVPVTTEKDYPRLPDSAKAVVRTLPVTVAWKDDEALDHLLEGL